MEQENVKDEVRMNCVHCSVLRPLELSIKYVNRDHTEHLESRDTYVGGLCVKVLCT